MAQTDPVKTAKTTRLKTIFELTALLQTAVDEAMKTSALDISPFLFFNNKGQGYMNEVSAKPEGFKNL